jgi:tetratricopeptide (TPR) repeat protein
MISIKQEVGKLEKELVHLSEEGVFKNLLALLPLYSFTDFKKLDDTSRLLLQHPLLQKNSDEWAIVLTARCEILEFERNFSELGKHLVELETANFSTPEIKARIYIAAILSTQKEEKHKWLVQLEENFPQLTDVQMQVNTLVHLALGHEFSDQVKIGQYLHQALKICREKNYPWLAGRVLCRLADWSDNNDMLTQAMDYVNEGLAICEQENMYPYCMEGYITRAILWQREQDFDNSIKNLDAAIVSAQTQGYEPFYAYTLLKKATMLVTPNREEEAIVLLNELLQLGETSNSIKKRVHVILGSIAGKNKDYEKAIEHFKTYLEQRGDEMTNSEKMMLQKNISTCYARTNSFEKAFYALNDFITLKLEVIEEERSKEIAKLQTQYETEKRETELRELKIKQQQTELERSESELKAIKAQMNPHFIFNALNSIQEMFFIGDKRLANEHLGKFSQLTREILKASGKQFISLAEEIDMLTKYLELEGLRFESDFAFAIHLNDEDVADDIQLPPMLIQPYVENAIRHGLLHKQGEKRIDIHFVFDEAQKQLSCAIEDNGVGREASAEINKKRKQLHESFSTSANAKRLDLLNQNRDGKIGVVYEDLKAGTKVTILIPVSYD